MPSQTDLAGAIFDGDQVPGAILEKLEVVASGTGFDAAMNLLGDVDR